MTDTVPPEIRPSQVSLRNINHVTEQPASVPAPSPRTSSTSSSDDRNVNIDASVAPRDGDEGSQTSGDNAEDFQDSISHVHIDLRRKPTRNFTILPKAKLVDENSYYGSVANKAIRRYNSSDLTTFKEILAVKQDLKTVNTIVDRKGNKAIVAATALRKIVVKLESALIIMSPEHQGLILEDNIESTNQINDIRRNVEKQLQKFTTNKINSKSRVTAEAALNRTLNFATENVHTIEQFLIELNGTDIVHSVLSEVPSLIAACKELVHLCDKFNVSESDI